VLDVTIEAKLREAMKDGIPKLNDHQRRAAAVGQVKPSDEGVVFDGAELCAVFESGRDV